MFNKKIIFVFTLLFYFSLPAFCEIGYKNFKIGLKKQAVIDLLKSNTGSFYNEQIKENGETILTFNDKNPETIIAMKFSKDGICYYLDVKFSKIPDELNIDSLPKFYSYLRAVLSKKYGEYRPYWTTEYTTSEWIFNNKFNISLTGYFRYGVIYVSFIRRNLNEYPDTQSQTGQNSAQQQFESYF